MPPEAFLVHSEAFLWTDGMGLGWSSKVIGPLKAPSLQITNDEWLKSRLVSRQSRAENSP